MPKSPAPPSHSPTADFWTVRRMKVMNPVYVAPTAVSAVDDHPAPSGRDRRRSDAPDVIEGKRSQKVRSCRLGHGVHGDVAMRTEIGRHAVGDQMDVVSISGQVGG